MTDKDKNGNENEKKTEKVYPDHIFLDTPLKDAAWEIEVAENLRHEVPFSEFEFKMPDPDLKRMRRQSLMWTPPYPTGRGEERLVELNKGREISPFKKEHLRPKEVPDLEDLTLEAQQLFPGVKLRPVTDEKTEEEPNE